MFIIVTDSSKVMHGVKLEVVRGVAYWYRGGRRLPYAKATAIGYVRTHSRSHDPHNVQREVNLILMGG